MIQAIRDGILDHVRLGRKIDRVQVVGVGHERGWGGRLRAKNNLFKDRGNVNVVSSIDAKQLGFWEYCRGEKNLIAKYISVYAQE